MTKLKFFLLIFLVFSNDSFFLTTAFRCKYMKRFMSVEVSFLQVLTSVLGFLFVSLFRSCHIFLRFMVLLQRFLGSFTELQLHRKEMLKLRMSQKCTSMNFENNFEFFLVSCYFFVFTFSVFHSKIYDVIWRMDFQ